MVVGADSGGSGPSITSMDDNLLDGDLFVSPEEMGDTDDGDEYELVGPDPAENVDYSDSGSTGGLPFGGQLMGPWSAAARIAASFALNNSETTNETVADEVTDDPTNVIDSGHTPDPGRGWEAVSGFDGNVDVPAAHDLLPDWMPWAIGGTLGTVVLLVVIFVLGQLVNLNFGGGA
jgi:hypothetical protein